MATKMTKAEATAAVKAIDWQKLLDMFPKLAALILQIIDLFKKQPVMKGAAGSCPSQDMCDCLTEQQTELIRALVHNAHMHDCCDPAPPTPAP